MKEKFNLQRGFDPQVENCYPKGVVSDITIHYHFCHYKSQKTLDDTAAFSTLSREVILSLSRKTIVKVQKVTVH